MSKSYWKWKAQGICYICRERPLWGDHVTCDECAKEQRRKQQARVEEARDRGTCTKCFKEPQAETSTLCVGCLVRVQRLSDPRVRQEEVEARPLRQWHGHSKARGSDPNQTTLL